MKTFIAATVLSLAVGSAFAQVAAADANANSRSSSGSSASASNGGQSVRSTNEQAQQQQQGQINGQVVEFNSTSNDQLKTVGNPGAVSYGVSFSQFNCANTAAIGGGWLGGVLQLGGPLESGPCNARANAAAFFQMAQALATSDPKRSAQLFNAAIRLIGDSTPATQEALRDAGVKEWKAAETETTPSSSVAQSTIPSQKCPGNYCGSDPLVLARLGIVR